MDHRTIKQLRPLVKFSVHVFQLFSRSAASRIGWMLTFRNPAQAQTIGFGVRTRNQRNTTIHSFHISFRHSSACLRLPQKNLSECFLVTRILPNVCNSAPRIPGGFLLGFRWLDQQPLGLRGRRHASSASPAAPPGGGLDPRLRGHSPPIGVSRVSNPSPFCWNSQGFRFFHLVSIFIGLFEFLARDL